MRSAVTSGPISGTVEEPSVVHSYSVRICHWINVIACVYLLVSGIHILLDFPELYWGNTGYRGYPPIFKLSDWGLSWEEAGRRGLQDDLTPSYQRAGAHLAVMRAMTTDFRDPVIWLIICMFTGGIGQFVLYVLLDQDLVKHDQAEVGVEYELAFIYHRFDRPVPDRKSVV